MADARERLVSELREHALVIGEVTLTSGATAEYYVDAKRAILRPDGFRALGELVAAQAERVGATAVGGMTMGADPVACAALAAGAPVKAFFVRKDRKEHGLAVAGVVSVLDRLAGGATAIEAAAGATYVPLTTIDDVYPDRPDRD